MTGALEFYFNGLEKSRELRVTILDLLRGISFGQRVAEDEGDQLAAYFVETDQWRRLFNDEVDIIYGPKGAGKSALHSLLQTRASELFDGGIVLAIAENPQGAPAFQALVASPDISERELVAIWKLYIACLACATLDEYDVRGVSADKLRARLEESGLRPKKWSLQRILKGVSDYVGHFFRPKAVEGDVKLDPVTQMPSGFTTRVLFGEPGEKEALEGSVAVDQLLHWVDDAIRSAKLRLWVLLDRLDVAFSDSPEIEQNALRALFHVYLDLLAMKSIRLKVFLRSDIWQRIIRSGFREASHITRHLTIEWNKASMLNLVVRRAVQNELLLKHFGLERAEVLATVDHQSHFFYLMFPVQVEAGLRKPNTFDWMLGRTSDSSRQAAPRELIHLLNCLRNVQVARLEVGAAEPEGGKLFSRMVFKEALPEVSRTRLQQTLYAEHPQARDWIERLRGEKTQHHIGSLSKLWGGAPDEALATARMLVEIGFFEERGEKDAPVFWVPFLYRDALDLIQGPAE